MEEKISGFRQHGARVRIEVRRQTIGYILTALGFVAGLAWNEAIKAIIDRFVRNGNGIGAKVFYAVVVTLVAVALTMYLIKLKGPDEIKE